MNLTLKLGALAALATIYLCPTAFASGECNGNQNCNDYDSHDNNNSSSSAAAAAASATGGAGGSAVNGPNVNTNVNENTAKGGSVSHSGNSDVDVKNHVSSSNKNTNHQNQNQEQNASASSDQSQGQFIQWVNPRNPVSTASAAALAVSPEACMGSSSIGGQGVGFGLSIGSTWENEDCKMRKGAGLLYALGKPAAAKELLCQADSYRAAFAAAGEPCSADQKTAESGGDEPFANTAKSAAFEPMAPIANDH